MSTFKVNLEFKTLSENSKMRMANLVGTFKSES